MEDDVCALDEALRKVLISFDQYQSLLYTRPKRESKKSDRVRENVFPSEALDEVLESMESGRTVATLACATPMIGARAKVAAKCHVLQI